MDEILDQFEDENETKYPYDSNLINESNWLRMFFSNSSTGSDSRLAFTYLLNRDNTTLLIVLFTLSVIMGYGGSEFSFFRNLLPDFLNEGLIGVFLSIIEAALFAIFTYVLYWKVGNWLGGVGDFKSIITVILWSNIPLLFTSLPASLMGILNDIGVSLTSFLTYFGTSNPVWLLINFIASIWSLVLILTGLSVAHKFENGKSCLVIIIAGFFIIVPIIYLMYIQGHF